MTLREQQAWLFELATGRASAAPEAAAFLKTAPELLGARVAIYENGHRARLVEALANDYPAVRRVLGEAAFGSLVVRYERRFPSATPDLGRVGQHFAGFLDSDALRAHLPFVADLARLEWALAEAFVARDEEPTAWGALARLAPDAVAERRFRLKAGTVLVRSRWPVLEIWRLKDRPDAEVDLRIEGKPQRVLVHRDSLELRCREIPETQATLVEQASGGFRLSELADDDAAAPGLVEAFRALVNAGILVDTEEERETR